MTPSDTPENYTTLTDVACGAWGAFGYCVNLRADQLGRWYCGAHRPQGVVW